MPTRDCDNLLHCLKVVRMVTCTYARKFHSHTGWRCCLVSWHDAQSSKSWTPFFFFFLVLMCIWWKFSILFLTLSPALLSPSTPSVWKCEHLDSCFDFKTVINSRGVADGCHLFQDFKGRKKKKRTWSITEKVIFIFKMPQKSVSLHLQLLPVG